MNNIDIIKSNFDESRETNSLATESILSAVDKATSKIIMMLENSGKLMTCGNGGSSGDAQHIASEFINRFETE